MEDDAEMSDLATISVALRAANDEDTRQALNVQSLRINVEAFVWYVVPSAWMRKAVSFLLAVNPQAQPPATWRQDLAIENKHLVAGVNLPHSGTNGDQRQQFEQKNALLSELKHKNKQEQQSASLRLKSNSVHGRDFVLLGPSAWLLCRKKFGFDYEVACPTLVSRSDPRQQLVVSVPLAGDEVIKIPFPTTGRFPVEALVKTNGDQGVDEMETSVVHPGNVSDDEGDDLVPLIVSDDMANPQDVDSGTVFLLPPSTTSTSPLSFGDNMQGDDDGLLGSDIVRRKPYGSGLGNLGNTCFMNSTLQCLAHTDPLRKYFLSGEYVNDLNRDNPLGTHGELAVQFASLLGEMWADTGRASSTDQNSRYWSGSAVYPRVFKQTLGRYTQQFAGYDQHDSQELAVYLLDKLHEDTNRITVKPYVETPELEVAESDEHAAKKAWELHLKRDDSKVLSFFMGQVKSRVQCCKPECGRVSTTFDPFMFLSVPIPGTSERTLALTFVPLDPSALPCALQITVSKMATIKDVLNKMVTDLKTQSVINSDDSLPLEDLCAVDVFKGNIYKWYTEVDHVDQIGVNDITFVYQLSSLAEVRANAVQSAIHEIDISHLGLHEWGLEIRRFFLDVSTREKLEFGDAWKNQFERYLCSNVLLGFQRAFNPSRGESKARADWYNKTHTFLSRSYKAMASDGVIGPDTSDASLSPVIDEQPLDLLEDASNLSTTFKNAHCRFDIAVLDFCLDKMRAEIVRLERPVTCASPDGALIQIRMSKSGHSKTTDITMPLVLRCPSDATVFNLRESLGKRLIRCLRIDSSFDVNEPTSDSNYKSNSDFEPSKDFGSPGLFILRQVPLKYERKSSMSSNYLLKPLGCVESPSWSETPVVSVAKVSDTAEKAFVAGVVGDQGSVVLEWPSGLLEKHFNMMEYETVNKQPEAADINTASGPKHTTILDCIERFGRMEQLEESEMWFCNRCHEHVQAWKSVATYAAPPILIIHLKRFHYSATTHRRDKIGVFIDFPLEGLDLKEHVLHWKVNEEPIYDCYAVSNHFGGLGGGHYTAYCLNDDGSWAYYDDSRITTNVDPQEVVSAAAYCLYYRRRDVMLGEDYPITLQTPSLHKPVVISDTLNSHDSARDDQAEVSSTTAAMIDDEEGMELDVPDNGSRCTSPMESVEENMDQEPLEERDEGYFPLPQ
ncbi:hypothetical protein MPSEU_000253900 [Mayamaea pseudoterrestris]|nr:hypothetical protein MPSEU_000253900 [Mayamaea pseudoterrestris]